MTNNMDVVICVGYKDLFIVKRTIDNINSYIKPDNIYIIANVKFKIFFISHLRNFRNLHFVDENEIIDSRKLTQYVECKKNFLKKKDKWYYQQFLKMGFSLTNYAKNFYLIWDADTIPTRSLNFFESGKVILDVKSEYHEPYFKTMEKLLGVGKSVPYSFISEHMLVSVKTMIEMLNNIEDNNAIEGNSFFEKIINSIDEKTLLGFSEFETYGTYLHNKYPTSFVIRNLVSNRNAGSQYGIYINKVDLAKIDDYDTISLEPANRPNRLVQIKQLPMKFFIKILSFIK